MPELLLGKISVDGFAWECKASLWMYDGRVTMLPYIHIIVPFYGVFVALGVMVSFLFFTKRSSMLSIDRLKKYRLPLLLLLAC